MSKLVHPLLLPVFNSCDYCEEKKALRSDPSIEPESMRIRLGSTPSCENIPSTSIFREVCDHSRQRKMGQGKWERGARGEEVHHKMPVKGSISRLREGAVDRGRGDRKDEVKGGKR
jgi:hypothetical protein